MLFTKAKKRLRALLLFVQWLTIPTQIFYYGLHIYERTHAPVLLLGRINILCYVIVIIKGHGNDIRYAKLDYFHNHTLIKLPHNAPSLIPTLQARQLRLRP